MRFRFKGLPLEEFLPLFAADDDTLRAKGIRRMVADAKPGFPCRITLEEAEPGERVLLLSYPHQEAGSPYRSSGPVFVREQSQGVFDGTSVPPVLRGRLLSLRAYDGEGMMVDADVVDGDKVEGLLERLFARSDTAYIHIHNARRGCYACYVERG